MPHHFNPLCLLDLLGNLSLSFVVVVLIFVNNILPTVHAQAIASTSPKRGLVYIPPVPAKYGRDVDPFVNASSDLTWYYNYLSTPTASLSTHLQFVPMLWGANDSVPGTGFYNSVKSQIAAGANITNVLAFNEPDGCSNGGSCVPASLAAEVWIAQIEPLKALGVRVGSPAVTGATTGFTWLANFFAACKGKCNPDFIAAHWYGDFEGLAAHLGQINASYPNISSIWVTEMALSNSSLANTEAYYNQTIPWLDSLSWVARYSWFGAFRSPVSNIGPNAAFLDQNGNLTNVGAWYLGRAETNNVPSTTAVPVSAAGVGKRDAVSSVALLVGVIVTVAGFGLL